MPKAIGSSDAFSRGGKVLNLHLLYSDSSHADMVAHNTPIAQLIDDVLITCTLNCVKEIHTGLYCLSKSNILQNT